VQVLQLPGSKQGRHSHTPSPQKAEPGGWYLRDGTNASALITAHARTTFISDIFRNARKILCATVTRANVARTSSLVINLQSTCLHAEQSYEVDRRKKHNHRWGVEWLSSRQCSRSFIDALQVKVHCGHCWFSLMVTYRFFPEGLIPTCSQQVFVAGGNAERDCEVYLCPQWLELSMKSSLRISSCCKLWEVQNG